ncbi:MAG TPA: class I SAM-dependent methyltransferase [Ktedonobacterales bacterium]
MVTLFRRFRRPTVVLDESREDKRFRLFGGRRHLVAVPYPLPKDMSEINRLDFQHYLLRTGFGGNFIAPVSDPRAILDVGSGSGRWSMEIAAAFPQAQVVGVDLVPPTVDDAQVLGHGLDMRPVNFTFATGNILEGLPFPDASFDFVHQRLLITAIPKDRWPSVIAELARVTRPGGWVELAECGVPERGGEGLMGLWGSWIEFLQGRGVDFTLGHNTGQMLANGGFGTVRQRQMNFPMGDWGGRIGRASATDCLAVGRALRAGVIAAHVLPEAEYDRLFALTEQEFANKRSGGMLPFYLACGQRGS